MKINTPYLTRFADGVRYLVVDGKRYRNLHRNCNGDPFSTPPLYGASGTPLDLPHLCKSLVWTRFGA